MKSLKLLAAAMSLALAMPASAALIFDQGLDSFGGAYAFNISTSANGQSYASRVELSAATSFTGMAIYGAACKRDFPWDPPCSSPSAMPLGAVGDAVTIRVFSGATPTLLTEFTGQLDAIDSDGASLYGDYQRKFSAFDTVLDLGPGTYWFAMSGAENGNIGQALVATGLDTLAAPTWFIWPGASPYGLVHDGSSRGAFRLYGEDGPAEVAEPGALGLSLFGFAGLIALRRRRSADAQRDA